MMRMSVTLRLKSIDGPLQWGLGVILSLTIWACAPTQDPPAPTLDLPSDTTSALLAPAETYIQAAQYDSAIAYLQHAYSTDGRTQWAAYVEALNRLGADAWDQGDYTAPTELLNHARTIGQKYLGPNHPVVGHTFHQLGRVSNSLGHYAEALGYHQQALSIRQAAYGETHPEVATSYNNLGYTYADVGDYDQALELYQNALQIRRAIWGETHPDVAGSLVNIGLLYLDKGDYDRALGYQTEALDIRRATLEAEDPEIGASYLNVGLAYDYLDDNEQALDYYNQARNVLQAALGEDHPWVAECYKNLGAMYDKTGETEQALDYYNRALRITRSTYGDNHPEVAQYYYNLGIVHYQNADYDAALRYFNDGLAIDRSALGENHPSVAKTYHDIGTLYFDQGDAAQALTWHRKALNLRQNIYGARGPDLAQSYLSIGAVHADAGRYEEALQAYQQALIANAPIFADPDPSVNPPLDTGFSDAMLLQGLRQKARILALRHNTPQRTPIDLEQAGTTYALAIDLIDRMRSGYKAEGSKLFLSENALTIYEEAIGTALQQHNATRDEQYKAQAWNYAERSKAGILLEAFHEAEARQLAGIPDTLLALERELRIDLAFYEQNLPAEQSYGAAADSVQLAFWQGKFFDRKQTYDELIQQFESDYPAYYNLKYQSHTATLEDVQTNLLDTETALVEYFVGDAHLYLFAVTDEQVEVHATPLDAAFTSQIKALRTGITTQDFPTYTAAASALYQSLLAPVASTIDGKTLLIVPAGPLHAIPFEALLTAPLDSTAQPMDYRVLPYLIQAHPVTYAYSATLLSQTLARQHTPASKDLLAFAPIFDDTTPGPSERETGHLPASGTEVNRILEQFETGYGFTQRFFSNPSTRYLQQAANEAAVKSSEVSNYRYVHLATHGFVDAEHPERSGLAFARADDDEDGILHLGEIYTLNLNADLVVLSACETGLGQLARGEGVIGLTRGFLYAGASNVLVSLWKVDDTATADLMVDFYSRMRTGTSHAEAIHQAKLGLISAHPRFARPYYWSSFVLVGQ